MHTHIHKCTHSGIQPHSCELMKSHITGVRKKVNLNVQLIWARSKLSVSGTRDGGWGGGGVGGKMESEWGVNIMELNELKCVKSSITTECMNTWLPRDDRVVVPLWPHQRQSLPCPTLTLCLGEIWVDLLQGLVETCFVHKRQQGHTLPGVLLAVQINLEVGGVEVDDGRLLCVQIMNLAIMCSFHNNSNHYI